MNRTEIVTALQEELGRTLDPNALDVVPDPFLDETFAVRLSGPDGEDPEFYLLTPDGVEEVEFTCWPPRSSTFGG